MPKLNEAQREIRAMTMELYQAPTFLPNTATGWLAVLAVAGTVTTYLARYTDIPLIVSAIFSGTGTLCLYGLLGIGAAALDAWRIARKVAALSPAERHETFAEMKRMSRDAR